MLFFLYDLQHIRSGQWETDINNTTSNIVTLIIMKSNL